MREETSGVRDFDFLFGSWKIRNRRLRERLKGCDEWDEFEADQTARPILGGMGNVDEFQTTLQGRDLKGVTLRTFNPATREWSLYWVDNWQGILQPAPVGRFIDGRGEFYADDTFEGRPIKVRFLWSGITRDAAHWEQAFSEDEGKTWETNWTMAFTRVE